VLIIGSRSNEEGEKAAAVETVCELCKVGEFGLIDRLHQLLINPGEAEKQCAGVVCGIGDDAAVLDIHGGEQVLVTTDLTVEGSHFIWGKISPSDLGHKLMASNLSDIAAMGGSPRFAVVSLGINDQIKVAEVEAVYQGMQELAHRFGTVIVGGDTVRSSFISRNTPDR